MFSPTQRLLIITHSGLRSELERMINYLADAQTFVTNLGNTIDNLLNSDLITSSCPIALMKQSVPKLLSAPLTILN